jgi:peroxiredoxin
LGAPAPAFSLPDLDGTTHTLAQYAGKTVVLEWFNPECPFVGHAHGPGGALATAARDATAQGIVWLAINSGAPGKQGTGRERNRDGAARFGLTHPILLDESGSTGKAYGAIKTPHVFVIDPKGVLVYRGGVDNAPMGEVNGGGARVDYLQAALADLAAGRPVATAEARPYGCSVKYGA